MTSKEFSDWKAATGRSYSILSRELGMTNESIRRKLRGISKISRAEALAIAALDAGLEPFGSATLNA